jgi:chromosome segregation ATPase
VIEMGIFTSNNTEKSVQRDIDAAKANRERLNTRLAENEAAIARHTASAKECALTGDDAGLERAEASLRMAQDRAISLRIALSEIDQRLADLEETKRELLDRKLRAQTAAEIELLVRKLTEVGADFVALADRLSEHTGRAVPIVFEANGVNNIVTICKSQVSEALEMVCKLLRAHGDAVIAGLAPATLPQPDNPALAAVPAPAAPPAEPHFTYRPAVKPHPAYKGVVQ